MGECKGVRPTCLLVSGAADSRDLACLCHRLLHELGDSEELRLEVRVLRLLAANPDGLTVHSIYRTLKITRKPVAESLTALEQDGRIQRINTPADGRPGSHPDLFRLVE